MNISSITKVLFVTMLVVGLSSVSFVPAAYAATYISGWSGSDNTFTSSWYPSTSKVVSGSGSDSYTAYAYPSKTTSSSGNASSYTAYVAPVKTSTASTGSYTAHAYPSKSSYTAYAYPAPNSKTYTAYVYPSKTYTAYAYPTTKTSQYTTSYSAKKPTTNYVVTSSKSYTPSYTNYVVSTSQSGSSKNIKNFDLSFDVNVNKQYNVSTNNPLIPSCSIWANDNSIPAGGDVTVQWSSTNATSATLSSLGAVQTNGIHIFNNLTSTQTYTLTVTSNTGHTNTCQTTVYVEQSQAPSCTLTITPSSVQSGNTASMYWSSNNATSASITSIGSVATNGSTTISPTSSKTYTMTVWNNQNQSNTCTAHVNVTNQQSGNLWCTISAQPSSIGSNGTSLLSWQSNGATSAWLSDGLGYVNPNGSLTVRPESTRTYTLTVSNNQGHTQTCTTTLGVTGNPYISLTQVPYTGFDFGPVGNMLYWIGLVLFAAGAAYFVLAYRGQVFGLFSRRATAETTILSEQVVSSESVQQEDTSNDSPATGAGDAMQLVDDGNMPRLVITRNSNPNNLPN